MHVQIVLFDGFDLLDALAPYEVFCAAKMYSGGALSVELVTAEGARSVASGIDGLPIVASGVLDPERAGIILIPGASGEVTGDGPASVPAILRRTAETQLPLMIGQSFKRSDITVATVCGGSLVLALAGLLEERYAVTNRLGMDVLGATGAHPVAARIVDDGNLVTGGGVTSGLDVALYLVERELGPRIAHAVETLFEFERRGTVWRNRGLAPVDGPAMPVSEEEPSPFVHHDESLQSARNPGDHSRFDGDWNVAIATPVGKLSVLLSISSKDGRIIGTAKQGGEVAEFQKPVMDGNRLCWSQRVTKPMRLNLKFEVTASGNVMSGVAKAGLLPASKLAGERIAEQGR
ncbi:DJ-1/PfpI family protein [Paenibacillus hemerocallicola]|uniref:DJ-1/PfpI family protein n=1 Tax=Paenibacillus hemerocallicola TaxID=1172614 RepID=A0A5C4TEI9_9BACL|nr:DJ-1/PfpI family protein [Paenibacillus hemerocallicola]TNJ67544.1 DJ-1/PfpI family protein [Paenibacillus hemerocallicola]